MVFKRHYLEGKILVQCYYQPEGLCPVSPDVELIDNGDGLEFRTRLTNIVKRKYRFELKFNVIHL